MICSVSEFEIGNRMKNAPNNGWRRRIFKYCFEKAKEREKKQ
jgi:hypothetical protein